MKKALFVGLDVHKLSISVAVAKDERGGKVRFTGGIPSTPATIIKKLAKHNQPLDIWYEAGPCGYDLCRRLISKGLTNADGLQSGARHH